EPLQREQEPQARIVELVAHADVANTLGVLLHSTPELGLLGERPGACFLSWHGGAVEGADLDSDAAGLELRQPIPLEQPLPAATQDELQPVVFGVENELEQDIVVSVDDHGRA